MRTTRETLRNIFKAAWQLVRRNGFDMGDALRNAWRNAKLKNRLQAGIAHFWFQKVDGSIREAYGTLAESPIVHKVAAVSVGVCDGTPTLDLDYAHDSTAEVDLNVVMTDDGRYVELQGTAEHKPFTEESLDALRALARKGLKKIFAQMKGLS